jgi:glycosyltransferase involved in cell wall biosynthesis
LHNTSGKKVLIIVENLPSPFDRRVWQEATTLKQHGYGVSIICPTGKGYEKKYEEIDGIHIYRHNLPLEAEGALGYLLEYSTALFWEFVLAWKVLFRHGFDAIHACNPQDNIFLVAGFFKLLGKKFLFDHHDINPELYEAKFGRRDFFYRVMLAILNTADVCVNPDVANEMNDKSTMNKIMEYMALGKPVVQFDSTEGRFSAQEASLYARRNDVEDLAGKILFLLDHPEVRARMGSYGKQRIETVLEWRHEEPKLLAAYQALFAR